MGSPCRFFNTVTAPRGSHPASNPKIIDKIHRVLFIIQRIKMITVQKYPLSS